MTSFTIETNVNMSMYTIETFLQNHNRHILQQKQVSVATI